MKLSDIIEVPPATLNVLGTWTRGDYQPQNSNLEVVKYSLGGMIMFVTRRKDNAHYIVQIGSKALGAVFEHFERDGDAAMAMQKVLTKISVSIAQKRKQLEELHEAHRKHQVEIETELQTFLKENPEAMKPIPSCPDCGRRRATTSEEAAPHLCNKAVLDTEEAKQACDKERASLDALSQADKDAQAAHAGAAPVPLAHRLPLRQMPPRLAPRPQPQPQPKPHNCSNCSHPDCGKTP